MLFGYGFLNPGGEPDAITGSGTVNRVAKFTSATTIGNSSAVDNGTTVIWDSGVSLGVGGITPTATVHIEGIGSNTETYGLKVENSIGGHIFCARNDGNVGIGTFSPTARLHTLIAGAATGALTFKSTGSLGGMEINDYGFVGIGTAANASNGLIIRALGSTFIKAETATNPLFEFTQPSGENCNLFIYGGGSVTHSFNSGGKNYINVANGLTVGSSGGEASAIIEGVSTTQGIRFPNMTTAQKNAIGSPAAGIVVYDTNLAKLCVYTTAWETITSI